MTAEQRLALVNDHIKYLADKESLTEDEAHDLKSYLDEADRIQLQVKAGGYVEREPAFSDTSGIDARMDEISANMAKLMHIVESEPAINRSGYVTVDGGTADKNVKSLGDWFLSLARGDTKRLTRVYKSQHTTWKDIEADSGAAGGFLIPEEYMPRLLELAASMSVVYPRCTVIPVNTDSGRIPALDQQTAPTAGQGDSAFNAGMTAATALPGAALTETQPTFNQIQYTIRKYGGVVDVDNEVIADSPFAIEALVARLASQVIASKREYVAVRGTGSNEGLGVMNSSVAIAVTTATDNTFAYADALGMKSRFKAYGSEPAWLIHPGLWPDIGIFETSNGGGVFQANLGSGLGNALLGYPLLESEHSPQDDNAGDAILADWSAYLFLERQQLAVSFSEHANFDNDQGVYRFLARFDGQPWLQGAVTLADPTGSYTVAPFVYHND